jgi:sec-independent protein translocase protein TatB
MIELSLGKMVLLALIALIVLGPEKLPGAARTAGALLRRVRSGWDNVKAEVERELEIEEIKRSAREAVASAEAAQQHVKDTLKEAHDPFAEAAAMIRLQPPASPDPVLMPEGQRKVCHRRVGSHQAHLSQDSTTIKRWKDAGGASAE